MFPETNLSECASPYDFCVVDADEVGPIDPLLSDNVRRQPLVFSVARIGGGLSLRLHGRLDGHR